MPLLALSLSGLDPLQLVRVDDPDHPGALVRSARGAVLAAPPPPGTPWRWESHAEPDGWAAPEVGALTHADLWHRAGHLGQGVRVAIFDVAWYGGDADPAEVGDVETHDCVVSTSCEPPFDPVAPRFDFETGAHGWSCAEIVRDVAPLAELHLVRVSGLTALENAVDWAIRHEIDVISLSMGFYNSSFYDGGGPFRDLLVDLTAAGILLVVSAGNNAEGHWSGPWQDTDRDGRLDVEGDNALLTDLQPGSHTFYVAWNQYGRCGDTDLDVALLTEDGLRVQVAAADQDADADNCAPNERLTAEVHDAGMHRLEVSLRRGVTAFLDVDVIAREGSLQNTLPARSLADPAAQPLAFTVSAVDIADWDEPIIASFSSQGPNHAGAPKPDIAGPNGLTTSSAGTYGFFGTSAAAPAVAGLVAVVLSEDPSLTPHAAADRLRAWALPQTPAAWDPAFGAGLAHLPPPGAGSPCGTGGAALLILVPAWGMRRARPRGRSGR